MSRDNPSTKNYLDWTFRFGPFTLGFERSDVYLKDKSNEYTIQYLQRWIIYPLIGTLRLHHFLRGDEERAFHDHPWWFVTFPTSTYFESVEELTWEGARHFIRPVRRFRFHFRGAYFRHRVVGSGALCKGDEDCSIWTFVITGRRRRTWGYWPKPHEFIDYKKWNV